ncbi:MFS transporter [Vibrio sp. CAIM 722]|uniref:MFS transporter n=1 Tax=Vibrio eleionomae TaxID=2653505 RepID=A0A7X4RVC6_9VIBR|nr:MFS transporter [Vibrio eleionomae]MZI94177.1 MFS transporter [Vibrio eleionomae]
MPVALYALAAAAFGIGMAEFVVVGILPAIAMDMHVDIPTAGQLVSYYALGVAVAAPILTALFSKYDRRKLTVGLMLLFGLANLLTTLAPSYSLLLLGRVLAGVVQGVFYSIATVIAADLVSKEKSGRAIGIVFSGMTIAIVSGVPAGAFITDWLNWRAAFAVISILGFVAMVALWFVLPANLKRPKPASVFKQLSVIGVPRMILVFLITGVGYGGSFIAYTYLSEILGQITGFSASAIGTILIFYGVAVVVGNIYAAKLADHKGPLKASAVIFVALAITLLLFGFVATNKFYVIPLIMIWGAAAFGSVPVLQLYVVQQAEKHFPHAVDASSSMNISAFNLGIAVGASVGGFVVAKYGLIATAPAAAAVVALSVLLIAYSGVLEAKDNKKLATNK